MRSSERPCSGQGAGVAQLAGHRLDSRDGEGFAAAERWQQPGQLVSQVGFAAAWRPHQQQVMAPCSGQGQGPCRQALLHGWTRQRFRFRFQGLQFRGFHGAAAGHGEQQRGSLLQLLDHVA